MHKKSKLYKNRKIELSCVMPLQFQFLCELIKKEPEKILYEFMVNAGMESYGLGETPRIKAMEYILSCGYGQDFYTIEDLRQLFKEMESIASLFPNKGPSDLLDLHAKWREEYYRYWNEKWYYKYRRK